ncbi:hypothetical protein [uncultured Mediterranean phage uvDeep-CGR2-KM18-C74]|nr:hypothetical protein [uncultured Mediterranean phage uvDeep-CGR2-KM18-C74]
MDIWATYKTDYPIPDGFDDPMNGGTDLFPSYYGFNDRMQIWMTNDFYSPIRIDLSYCRKDDCCQKHMVMDMCFYREIKVSTWEQALEEIEKYRSCVTHRKWATRLYLRLDKITEDLLRKEHTRRGEYVDDAGDWLYENHPDEYDSYIALDYVENEDRMLDLLDQWGNEKFLEFTKESNRKAFNAVSNYERKLFEESE